MIDWNNEWNKALLASRLTDENYYDREERAVSYDGSEKIWTDGLKRAKDLNPDPSWSVLDIGSGPGTLTIPLARMTGHVTAVEPSRAMARLLEKHLAQESLSNVDIINSRFEDISAGDLVAHDLVIASYSLNFDDIRDELLKMNRLAEEMVVLYWFAGTTNWERLRMDLSSEVSCWSPAQSPKCNIIYNVLYDIGIYPDIEVLDASFSREYADFSNAMFYLKSTLNIDDESCDDILSRYIEDHWRRSDGSLFMDDKTRYVKISWRPVDL